MEDLKRLPDSEFEVMKAVWECGPPVTANMVLDTLEGKDWKSGTVITFLKRLVNKGYLSTEKTGKERAFYPLVSREEYLQFETGEFLHQYHGNSLVSMMNTLVANEDFETDELEALLDWVKKRGEEK